MSNNSISEALGRWGSCRDAALISEAVPAGKVCLFYRWFSYEKWWFFIATLNNKRVCGISMVYLWYVWYMVCGICMLYVWWIYIYIYIWHMVYVYGNPSKQWKNSEATWLFLQFQLESESVFGNCFFGVKTTLRWCLESQDI